MILLCTITANCAPGAKFAVYDHLAYIIELNKYSVEFLSVSELYTCRKGSESCEHVVKATLKHYYENRNITDKISSVSCYFTHSASSRFLFLTGSVRDLTP